eukprot:scaffold424933_cov27-Prasinocladus_malaysianus.AAC.2
MGRTMGCRRILNPFVPVPRRYPSYRTGLPLSEDTDETPSHTGTVVQSVVRTSWSSQYAYS